MLRFKVLLSIVRETSFAIVFVRFISNLFSQKFIKHEGYILCANTVPAICPHFADVSFDFLPPPRSPLERKGSSEWCFPGPGVSPGH